MENINEEKDLFVVPEEISEEEKKAWVEISKILNENTRYKKSEADRELLRQYCQTKVLRDRAWIEYNLKPERYIRFVVGLCQDGKTPKVVVKENEHYRTLTESNKQLERLMKELKLTPIIRSKAIR